MSEIPSYNLTVKEDDDGQRFDRWLKKQVQTIPYGLVQKLIRKGAFRIDGKKAKADTKLSVGQEIRIPAHEAGSPKKWDTDKSKQLSPEDEKFMRSMIIYEDEHLLAINKPEGLAVQGGSKVKRHIDGLLPALVNDKGVVPRLVHRLDKDTSGVMLLARSSKMARLLGDLFKGREMQKIYWALTLGVPEVHDGKIIASLRKAGGENKERMIIDPDEGKFAQTDYIVVDHAHRQASFIAFLPHTGRMHQIRVHAEALGCPIIGDLKYCGANYENPPEPIDGIEMAPTLHLHARRLIFKHPITHKRMDIVAPLPANRAKSWKALGFNPNDKTNPFDEQ